MAINTSTDFTQTRDQVITDAFQLLGVYGLGKTIIDADKNFASNQLNKMLKSWEMDGLHLWTKVEGVQFLQPTQASYQLGNSSADYACNLSDASFTATTATLLSGVTAIPVISTAGMTAADYIGIVMADNTVFWTTISTVDSSTQVTISSPITQNINSGMLIYSFTTKINKPLRVLTARRATGYDGNPGTLQEALMSVMSYQDYQNMTSKYVNGVPNQYCYLPNALSGSLFLWQRPAFGSDRIHFTYERAMGDMDNATDNFDLPQEWLEVITWQLAVRLGTSYGRGEKVNKEILPIASLMLDRARDWDREITYVDIWPDKRG